MWEACWSTRLLREVTSLICKKYIHRSARSQLIYCQDLTCLWYMQMDVWLQVVSQLCNQDLVTGDLSDINVSVWELCDWLLNLGLAVKLAIYCTFILTRNATYMQAVWGRFASLIWHKGTVEPFVRIFSYVVSPDFQVVHRMSWRQSNHFVISI